MTEKEVELAKSWFALSQMLMILAGFLFAASGVAYSNSVSISRSWYDTYSGLVMQIYGGSNLPANTDILINLTGGLLRDVVDAQVTQIGLSKRYENYGFYSIIISLICWYIGYLEIKKSSFGASSNLDKH